MIAQSVFSGHRLAREIDSDDPATPLPFIRERRLLDSVEDDYMLDAAAMQPSAVADGRLIRRPSRLE